MHDISLQDKTSVENEEIIDLFEMFKEEVVPTLDLSIEPNSTTNVVHQNQVEEAKMIEMFLPIYIEDKEIVLEEDLIEKMKFIGKYIDH